jgi:hypothetical protein
MAGKAEKSDSYCINRFLRRECEMIAGIAAVENSRRAIALPILDWTRFSGKFKPRLRDRALRLGVVESGHRTSLKMLLLDNADCRPWILFDNPNGPGCLA